MVALKWIKEKVLGFLVLETQTFVSKMRNFASKMQTSALKMQTFASKMQTFASKIQNIQFLSHQSGKM